MTPLTRQVMTKSIHRAILEYQSHHGSAPGSPKSPLDLRVRTTITRDSKDVPKDSNDQSANKIHQQPSKIRGSNSSWNIVSNGVDKSNSKSGILETVYEQEKDAKSDDHDDDITSDSYAIIKLTDDSQVIVGPSTSEPISETPILVTRKISSEKLCTVDKEVWYTPKEFVQSKVIENIEVNLDDFLA